MSLEKDFKCNLGSKNDEKKQEPFGSQHGEGREQNLKKGFLKKFGNGDHSYGQGKGGPPQFGKKWPCSRCGKTHDSQTWMEGVKVCYTCKQLEHFAGQCLTTKVSGSSSTPQVVKGNDDGKRVEGRVYTLTTQDAQATDTVVTGILPLFSTHARVLLILVPHIILFLVPY